MTATCPRCQTELTVSGGMNTCSVCSLEFNVEVEPPPPINSIPRVVARGTPPPRHSIFYYVFWGTVSFLVTIAILVLVFAFMTGFMAGLSEVASKHVPDKLPNETENVRQPQPTPSAQLKIGEWNWRKSSKSHVTVEGEVTNVSGKPLEDVQVVVTFRTKSGEFISSDDALIGLNPILPGQASPWKVIAKWNPAMEQASVHFKFFGGGSLKTQQ